MKIAIRIHLLVACIGMLTTARAVESLAPVAVVIVSAAPLPASTFTRLKLTFDPPSQEAEPAPNAVSTGVVILPKFEVRNPRLNLSPRDVQSAPALLAEAKARYLNSVYQKTGGQLMAVLELLVNPLGGWRPNDATALTLYAQDERLRRMRESSDLIDVYQDSDPPQHRQLKEMLFNSYQHEPDQRPGVLRRR